MNLSSNVKITKVQNATVAGTSAINATAVDMQGYEGVMFMVTPGTITSGAVTSINAAQSTDNSSFADLEGSGITIADDDDNQVFWLDVYKPRERYVRLEVARATQNAVIGEIYAIQYGARVMPVDNNVADTITGEVHVSPAEGTA